MAKQRIPLFQNPRNFASVEDGATKGARVGTDLLGPDGKVLTADQIINPTQTPESSNGGRATVWKLIREVPANLIEIAKLAGKGFAARLTSGEWALRTFQAGDAVEIQNGDGEAGNPIVSLTDEALAALALAETAVQEVRAGTNVAVDNTDPKRPIVSASGGGGDNPIYPQLTDQLGNLLTDQQGQPLRQNAPAVPWAWLYGVPDFQPLDSDLTAIAGLTGAGVPLRAAGGTWTLATLNTLPAMTLAAANALTGVADFQMVAITDLAGGREPCWYDTTVVSGTKWRRFSDRSIAN